MVQMDEDLQFLAFLRTRAAGLLFGQKFGDASFSGIRGLEDAGLDSGRSGFSDDTRKFRLS